MVTPSYLLNIADEVERQSIRKEQLSLRIAMVGAEPWTKAMREEINRRLNLTAIDYYGISEVIGPGVASECIETLDGPTLWEDHFYPEIINPDTGEVLPDGSHGELVVTSLTKEALPIIRYRTRDLTRLLPGTARPMRRLGQAHRSSDDMLIIRGVNFSVAGRGTDPVAFPPWRATTRSRCRGRALWTISPFALSSAPTLEARILSRSPSLSLTRSRLTSASARLSTFVPAARYRDLSARPSASSITASSDRKHQ